MSATHPHVAAALSALVREPPLGEMGIVWNNAVREAAKAVEQAIRVEQVDALDRAYADADAFDRARQCDESNDGDDADQMAELRKAALSRGQP